MNGYMLSAMNEPRRIGIDRAEACARTFQPVSGAMAAASKLRLSVLLLFLQLLFYLYVLPRGNGAPRQEDPGGDYLLSRACRQSYPPEASSPSGMTFFLRLSENCGIRLKKPEKPPPPPPPLPVEEEVTETPLPDPVVLPPPPVCQHPEQEEQRPPVLRDPQEEEGNRSGNLIYQIIMVLLFLSVSFALADCFQERAKKRANPDRHDGLSRRMSLADLTMSRHARRESQASYRPIGVKRQPLVSRSCSHDLPVKAKPVLRQASCPLLDDDATTERRRVRMIQRH